MRVQLLIGRFALSLCLILTVLCVSSAEETRKDYAAMTRPDLTGRTSVTAPVTVRSFIDGDTTHFYLSQDGEGKDILKARYLAVNTPETTGKVEEYGKKASDFTRSRLENAAAILVESDDTRWNIDSTGSRTLVWVWYLPEGESEYRNLNIELLQNGLAIASNSANNRYGDLCMSAIAQAKAEKLNIYSGQKDPDFYYGDAIELTLRELRVHPEEYNGKKVAFNGIITANSGNSVYVESTDAETGLPFGISVYYGYSMNGAGLDILSVGNEARIVGTMQYYEMGGTWQVSGLTYRMMKPKDTGNIQKLSSGHAASFTPVTASRFMGNVVIPVGEGEAEFPYAALVQATTLEMAGLTVRDAYCSDAKEWTLSCESAGTGVQIFAPSLRDGGALIGHTVTVRGIADAFDGTWQIRVLSENHIVITD